MSLPPPSILSSCYPPTLLLDFPNDLQANRDPSVFKLNFNPLNAHPIARKHLNICAKNCIDILIEKGYCFNPDSDYINPFDVQRVLEPDSGVSSTNRDGVVYGIWCPVDDTSSSSDTSSS